MLRSSQAKHSYSENDITHPIANSPLQRLQSPFLQKAGIQLYVKRDDLIHPQFGGNKWRKLKYNLIHFKENKFDRLLTFGGAWSNHIYATAAAGKHFNINTIGLIRGEQHTPLNACISFARECGMELHYIDRVSYREKNELAYQQHLQEQFSNVYILPEGGSNLLALKGCKEIVSEINAEIDQPFDLICCASGTGATLAGIISAINADPGGANQRAIGFSALKGGEFLQQDVLSFLQQENPGKEIADNNWNIESRFHFSGYAKINDELVRFMRDFRNTYGFELDAVYTAKMFYGLFKQIESGVFRQGSSIVAVHSGGLQGNKGFNL